MLSSAPGSLLRKPGLESLFECERKPVREKHSVVFLCVCVCVCVHTLYACVTCALLCARKCFYFRISAVCVSVLEIKFVWEIEKEKLKDRVKEVKIDRYRER